MKKTIFVYLRSVSAAAFLLGGALTGHGQDKKHEFAVSAGGIFSYLDYDLEQGKTDQGHGFNIGLRYSYYFSENWSLGLGAEYQYYNTDASIASLNDNYMATDFEGESFEFRYNARRIEERQRVGYINIPLTIQYETGDYPAFYAAAGAKIGFAVNQTYETSMESLTTSGYYAQYDAELFDPRFAGFGNFGSVDPGKQDLDLNISYLATFEAGVKQLSDNDMPIYIGLFIDYGLNNVINKDSNKEIVEYTDTVPVNFKYNSLLDTSNTGDVKLLAYGIKVRVGLW